MQSESFRTYLKRTLNQSGMMGKLIAINLSVFLFFFFLEIAGNLFARPELANSVKVFFIAPGNPAELFFKPWAIITQLFTHADFMHLAFNMLMLYFVSHIFVLFFGERRLLSTYLFGGIFAYIFHVIAYYSFPSLAHSQTPSLLGASASVMAVFVAAAAFRPGHPVHLFGLIKVPLFVIAALYVFSDLASINNREADNIAHFAHLGGALFGVLSVLKISFLQRFMNWFDRWFFGLKRSGFSVKRKAKMKVFKGGGQEAVRKMSDDEFNTYKKEKEERINIILEKISKKGYDGLSKEEKEILFNESKR